MIDDIAHDHVEPHTRVSDRRPQQVAERERRETQVWRVQKYSKPAPWPDPTERSTATASWGRSVLIIAVLSTLCWGALVLLVIGLLSAL